MSDPSMEEDAISRISVAFDRFTMTTEEAVKIRTTLAAYVDSFMPSQIGDTDSEKPPKATRLPKEISGVRRRFLNALRENNAVRQSYHKPIPTEKTVTEKFDSSGAVSSLHGHLRLLKLRNLNTELELLHHYAIQLDQQMIGGNYFDSPDVKSRLTLETEVQQDKAGFKITALVESGLQLIANLEIAVLQAQHQFERSRDILSDLRSRQELLPYTTHNTQCRLEALSHTRDELVRWIEGRLSQTGPEIDFQRECLSKVMEPAERNKKVSEQYATYIELRRRLVETVALATAATLPEVNPIAETVATFMPSAMSQHSVSTLPFIEKQLSEMARQKQLISTHEKYMSEQLSRQNANTLDALGRLSDESHLLLPDHHILAGNHQSSQDWKEPNSQNMSRSREGEDIVKWARAWASAGLQAKNVSEEITNTQVTHGIDSALLAKQQLADLERLLSSTHIDFAERNHSQVE